MTLNKLSDGSYAAKFTADEIGQLIEVVKTIETAAAQKTLSQLEGLQDKIKE